MVQSLLISYGAMSAAATFAYLIWGWARARRQAPLVVERIVVLTSRHRQARQKAAGCRSDQ